MNDVTRKEYRPLSAFEQAQINEMKQQAELLIDMIEATGASREQALAKTKVEEAVMWAVKGVTRG